jgi:hypothetical protein
MFQHILFPTEAYHVGVWYTEGTNQGFGVNDRTLEIVNLLTY